MNKDNFKKVSHVSYSDEYITLYEEESTGVQMQVSVKRISGGFGVGKSKTIYYVKGSNIEYKTYDAALAAANTAAVN